MLLRLISYKCILYYIEIKVSSSLLNYCLLLFEFQDDNEKLSNLKNKNEIQMNPLFIVNIIRNVRFKSFSIFNLSYIRHKSRKKL